MNEVLTSIDGAVATVTLNRPEKRNSISHNMLVELCSVVADLDRATEVRVIVLTGAGRAFCSGLDLNDAASEAGIARGGFPLATKLDVLHSPTNALYETDKPVLCAINGGVAGYGLDLALSCDIRFCEASSKLSVAHTRRGVFPDMGGTWLLPRLLGWSKAAELVFAGKTLTATEAQRCGLVDHVAEDGQLMDAVTVLAQQIAECAPLAVQAAKRLMRAGIADSFAAHVQQSYLQVRLLTETRDFGEGVAAFLEKRAPAFRGE